MFIDAITIPTRTVDGAAVDLVAIARRLDGDDTVALEPVETRFALCWALQTGLRPGIITEVLPVSYDTVQSHRSKCRRCATAKRSQR
jgi:hypothetical protein